MERYKIYENKDKFDIYEVTGRYIVSCTNSQTAEQIAKMMNADAIIPANDNSILKTPIAKATRKLLDELTR